MLSEATSGLSLSAGCRRSSIDMVGAPPVVRLTTTSHALFTLGRNCLNSSGSCVGLPSFGLRAWKCTIAAPAFAAPIAASAISAGVTGRYGDMLGVWIEPVTAQVMMTLPCAAAIVRVERSGRSYERRNSIRIDRVHAGRVRRARRFHRLRIRRPPGERADRVRRRGAALPRHQG